MSVFTLDNCKTTGTIPDNCKEIIKRYKSEGMFDMASITNGRQEYTTLYLLMTQDCNLSCPYCYQPKEFRQKNRVMSNKIIDDTINFAINTFDDSKLKFSIFGGEPLLNFESIKYMVDKYPMFRYIITTNGLRLIEDKEVKEWIIKHKNCIDVSVSIGSLKYKLGPNYLKKCEPIFEVINNNGTDIHYVIDEPNEEAYNEVLYLFSKVPVVRVSSTRHQDSIRGKIDNYIKLFNKIADYVYFGDKPQFGRTQWDVAFKNNIYKKFKGLELKEVPPTFCGCGYLYLAINDMGDIYPCDFFANFSEFRLGSIYTGFNDTALFFKKMGDWVEGLYEDCKECKVCDDGDIRLCPRAMCLAENYIVTGNPLKPAPNHCYCNKIEYENYKYIAQKAIKLGLDKKYESTCI